MKKGAVILVFGVLVCTVAFAGLYSFCMASHRELLRGPEPELAWLKREFRLSDADLVRISHIHETCLPECQGRCRIIREQNEKLRQLLVQADTVTPEIKALLTERATTRAECEAAMLSHFLDVSRAMPPGQGQRYLAWVEQHTLLQIEGMENIHVKVIRGYQLPPQPEASSTRVWNE